MSTSIINAKKGARERLSWEVVRASIRASESLPNEISHREYMGSSSSRFLSEYPQTEQKRKDLITAIETYLAKQDMRVIDYHILSQVVFLLRNKRDASQFFSKNRSINAERVALYARTRYEFNDNNKKDEELY
jgi:hypothetical protein